jgi:bifunctional DNA-binding transcriptional regulator/antitoxin component of YhaV-PrlF toxin-antitoxin module
MRTAMITTGGQVSIPAEVRHRWGTRRVIVEDHGDALVLRPLPADPIGAALGSLAGPGLTTDEMRAALRRDDAEIERLHGRAGGGDRRSGQ